MKPGAVRTTVEFDADTTKVMEPLRRAPDLQANLIPDEALAALCSEHGLEMNSAESDFARFTEVPWHNPLA